MSKSVRIVIKLPERYAKQLEDLASEIGISKATYCKLVLIEHIDKKEGRKDESSQN